MTGAVNPPLTPSFQPALLPQAPDEGIRLEWELALDTNEWPSQTSQSLRLGEVYRCRNYTPVITKPGTENMMNVNDLKLRMSKAGQEHLLHFWNELEKAQQVELYAELQTMNFEGLNFFYQKVTDRFNHSSQPEKVDARTEPVLQEVLCKDTRDSDQLQAWETEEQGLFQISQNKVAVLLAGGQGTRPSVACPYGMYDVGLPSCRTLFQIQSECILRLQ